MKGRRRDIEREGEIREREVKGIFLFFTQKGCEALKRALKKYLCIL